MNNCAWRDYQYEQENTSHIQYNIPKTLIHVSYHKGLYCDWPLELTLGSDKDPFDFER